MINSYAIKSALPVFLQALLYKINALLRLLSAPRMSDGHGKDMFFIVGCGRSGNTLLRSMLMSGGEVCIPPESYVLPRAIALYKAYGFLPWAQLSSLVISEFEAFPEFSTWHTDLSDAHIKARLLPKSSQTFERIVSLVYAAYRDQHFEKAIRLGDKTPINSIFLGRVFGVYSKAKYVHILRDPRACIASYMKSDMRDIDEATNFWLTATRNCIALERKVDSSQFMRVEYELLVTQPRVVLEPLCRFLGVSYSDDMLEFWKMAASLGDVDVRSHHANTKKPLSIKSIDAWKEVLSDEQVQYIESKCLPIYNGITRR